ncbi:MAG TPA: RdgB/HAM1 family non-canonical purine NTP pyrophosphatase [Steroidobacteraceae bacterium]|nr:RdgB/HAM1 family non-canonical purine NTP pyrophosphatase [Steroidobacteraceae bacterium]
MVGPKSVVLASGNRGKLAEFAQLLAPWAVHVHAQSDFVAEGADETGANFRENALLKARHAARAARMPAIADDSGLEVDALDGAPGVYSARYAGETATDEDNNRKLLASLASIPAPSLTARFRCVLAYVRHADDDSPVIVEGVWEGHVLMQPRGEHGFGYDPLFQPLDAPKSAAELSGAEKNQLSHRGKACGDLLVQLQLHGELAART